MVIHFLQHVGDPAGDGSAAHALQAGGSSAPAGHSQSSPARPKSVPPPLLGPLRLLIDIATAEEQPATTMPSLAGGAPTARMLMAEFLEYFLGFDFESRRLVTLAEGHIVSFATRCNYLREPRMPSALGASIN